MYPSVVMENFISGNFSLETDKVFQFDLTCLVLEDPSFSHVKAVMLNLFIWQVGML